MPPNARHVLLLPFVAVGASLVLAYAAFAPSLTPVGGWKSQLAVWGVVVPATVGYVVGYFRLLRHGDTPAARRVLVAGAVPLCVLAVLVPPFDSTDLHSYANIGRTQVVYGANPYTTPLSHLPGWAADPHLTNVWAETPCAYSFLFAREAAAVVRLVGPEKPAVLTAFKLVNVVALALTVWVVAVGCGRLGVSRALGVYVVAWNPFVLLHGVSNGHNDVLSGLGLAAGLLLAGSRWWCAALPALTAAALVKYSTVPLLPLAGLFLARRHGWGRAALSAVPCVALAAWAAWPYLADGGAGQASRSFSNLTDSAGSLGSVVVVPLRALGKVAPAWAGLEGVAATGLKVAGGLVVLGVVGRLAWRRGRARRYPWPEFVRDAALVQVVLVAVSAKFFAWYLLMFWPVVAWLPEASRLKRALLAVAAAQTASVTFLGRAHVVYPLALLVAPVVWALRRERPAARAPLPFVRPPAPVRRAA